MVYHHQHSGIGFHTPADVHYGLAAQVAANRSQALAEARAKHPHRFDRNTDPKILDLLRSAWINKPLEDTEIEAA